MDSISGTKKKKKLATATSSENELIQFHIEVAKPGSKKYTHVDWEELLKKKGVEKDEETLRRFYDEDTLFMAKKLGETRSKSGKHIRINLDHIQYLNRNCGYDMDDDFIDDTEAVDDMLPVVTKKGGFYVGKGEVKKLDDDEEEEESEEEEMEVQKKPRKKYTYKDNKDKEKPTSSGPTVQDTESGSSSGTDDNEPIRMTGAPPTARMTGAPPSKRIFAKRPSPPTRGVNSPVRQRSEEKEKPPAEKKKKENVKQDQKNNEEAGEPPAKKKAVELTQTTSSSSTISIASSSSSPVKIAPPTLTPQKSTVAQSLTKKTPEEVKNGSTSAQSPPKDSGISSLITSMFTSLQEKIKLIRKKEQKPVWKDVLKDLKELIGLGIHHSVSRSALIDTFSKKMGISDVELTKLLEESEKIKPPVTSAQPVQVKKEVSADADDWRITKNEVGHMSEPDLLALTLYLKSWKSGKTVTPEKILGWLKDVNVGKLTLDQARNKLVECVNKLPDAEKTADGAIEMPKHERSRKPRMFLNQWVFISRKYIEILLPTIKRPSMEVLAQRQLSAINTLKEALKKQIVLFESKKDKTPETVYQFQFTEPVLTAIWPYLDELLEFSLASSSLDLVVKGIDSLHHQALEGKIPLTLWYIELCRRFQKMSFLAMEEPMKSRLATGKESITRHQVVQNPKYMIKWPEGVKEPSLKGLNVQLYIADNYVSVFQSHGSKKNAIEAKEQNGDASTSKEPQPQNISNEKEINAMNQVVQVYIAKYLLSSSSDPSELPCSIVEVPMSDETIIAMVMAVNVCGILASQHILVLKNILALVGQVKMSAALSGQKCQNTKELTMRQYQLIFEWFQKYESVVLQKRQQRKEAEERAQLRVDEKARREKEKQLEKEKKEKERELERIRKDKEKQEEKERKEKEKREERERKEREQREAAERKRQEEEDRRKAIERIRIQQEDERRKREAAEAVEKELERRAKMETEAASALQFLEEDNLMDDAEFISEQMTRVNQERKLAEKQRALERENQIKLMRAQQLERTENVGSTEVVQVLGQAEKSNEYIDRHTIEQNKTGKTPQEHGSPFPQVPSISFLQQQAPFTQPHTSSYEHAIVIQENPTGPHSSSHFQNNQLQQQSHDNLQFNNLPMPQSDHFQAPTNSMTVKQEPVEVDILAAAQEAAEIPNETLSHNLIKKELVEESSVKKTGALEQLQKLRERTKSADMKRAQGMFGFNGGSAGSPIMISQSPHSGYNGTPSPMAINQSPHSGRAHQQQNQHFFPTNQQENHSLQPDVMMMNHQQDHPVHKINNQQMMATQNTQNHAQVKQEPEFQQEQPIIEEQQQSEFQRIQADQQNQMILAEQHRQHQEQMMLQQQLQQQQQKQIKLEQQRQLQMQREEHHQQQVQFEHQRQQQFQMEQQRQQQLQLEQQQLQIEQQRQQQLQMEQQRQQQLQIEQQRQQQLQMEQHRQQQIQMEKQRHLHLQMEQQQRHQQIQLEQQRQQQIQQEQQRQQHFQQEQQRQQQIQQEQQRQQHMQQEQQRLKQMQLEQQQRQQQLQMEEQIQLEQQLRAQQHQMNQMNQYQQQNQTRGNPQTNPTNTFSNQMEQRERRPHPHHPQPTTPSSYQSPGHPTMSNSSLMHTPMSSELSSSSPMSQQFHTPPSVGMIPQNHQLTAQQQMMSTQNFPPAGFQQRHMTSQMQRQMSQQQHQMQQNLLHQQQMMRQQYPPNQ